MTELIIFDFDGTLADTTASTLRTYQATIDDLKAEPRSDAECQATIGLPLREGFRALYPDFSKGMLDRCVATYRRIYYEHPSNLRPELYPGVRPTLELFSRAGIKMSVASSRTHQSLVEMCEVTGIAPFFSLILGAEDVVHAKPNPEPVLLTLKRLGADSEHTVVVGDMPVDIAMGRGAGCRTVGVTFGNSNREALTMAGADNIIDSFTDLLI